MPDLNNIEQQLDTINRIITSLNPMVGAFEGLVTLVLQIAQHNRVPVQSFEEAYAEYRTRRDDLKAALDEFRQKYPTDPQPPTA